MPASRRVGEGGQRGTEGQASAVQTGGGQGDGETVTGREAG